MSNFYNYAEILFLQAREKKASRYDIQRGIEYSGRLIAVYKPFIMRRTKQEIFKRNRASISIDGNTSINLSLPTKLDWVVWIKLCEKQCEYYRAVLRTDEFKDVMYKENIICSLM